ncbi:MAG: HWE histidine kinase domain-containing protein [Pseudomonadota bacterium]
MSTLPLDTIFDQMPQASMVLDENLNFLAANQAYCRAVQRQKDQLIGRNIFDVFPDTPERVAIVRAVFQRALDGEVTHVETQPYKLLAADGTYEDRIWDIEQFPLASKDGDSTYMIQYCEDVTEREALRVQRDLVTAELNHRVRNTLAVVQSVAEQTGLTSADIESFLTSFSGRLAAISRNFAALTQAHWHGLKYEHILQTELEPYMGPHLDRISLHGPPLTLTVRASKFTSMLLHELITNASKYGFLTAATGRLNCRWWLEDDLLYSEWHETGLENITPPETVGFGFQLFDMMENINVNYEFLPTGLKLCFTVPIKLSVAADEDETEAA